MGGEHSRKKTNDISKKGASSSVKPVEPAYRIIWLDQYVDSTKDGRETVKMLREINGSVILYKDPEECVRYIGTILESKILLVTSGYCGKQVLPAVSKLPQVIAVFIFCQRVEQYKELKAKHSVIVGVFDEQSFLIRNIRKTINSFSTDLDTFVYYDKKQKTTRDLTQQAASFLWYQLLTEILLQVQHTGNAKSEMLDHCRLLCEEDPQALKDIETFEKSYKAQDAVRWYTKDSFVHKLLNKALRTEDAEALYIFRFYITDLSKSLLEGHTALRNKLDQMTVYRGQYMDEDELQRMQRKLEMIISLNGYLSTSRSRDVAVNFVRQESRPTPWCPVLFIIHARTDLNNVKFADISQLSVFPVEQEVLFNIGAAFYIDKVKYDKSEQLWQIELTATDEGFAMLDSYIQLMKAELEKTSSIVLFGTLLIDMGNYKMAQKYFHNLTEIYSEEHPDMADIYYNLARTFYFLRKNDDAEEYFKMALKLQRHGQDRFVDIIRTLNGIGWVLQTDQLYTKAREKFEEAEKLAQSQLNAKHPLLAQTYSCLGQNYLEVCQFGNAQSNYKKALDIETKIYPAVHPKIASTLINIGDAHRKNHSFEKAFEYYKEAYKMQEETLPEEHPLRAYCLSCLGLIYQQRGEIERGQEYHRKAHKIYRRVLPNGHINIETSKRNSRCDDYQFAIDTYIKPLF